MKGRILDATRDDGYGLQISMGMENRGRQLLAIPPAIACNLPSPTRAPFGSSGRVLEEKAFMPPARVGCMWHPKHIKSSSGTVRLKFRTEWRTFVCKEPKNLGSSPMHSGLHKTRVGNILRNIHFHFPAWHKQGPEIAGNCPSDFRCNHTDGQTDRWTKDAQMECTWALSVIWHY